MILSTDKLESGQFLNTEIVIVGTGAAGIPMALELAEKGHSVLLMEAGLEELDDDIQSAYSGSVTDPSLHNPPDTYRQRRLGGSTVIWGGRCIPFDPVDFAARDYIPNSGWPIGPGDLAPFYSSANQWLEAGRYDYSALSTFGASHPPMIAGFSSERISTDGLERFSRPTDLFQRYRNRLSVEKNISLYCGVSCVSVKLESHGSSVNCLDFLTRDGKRFSVKAERYVLATGGIEVPRLLLASNDVLPQGIGNGSDCVGRYYQCHIAGNVGKLQVNGAVEAVRHGYEVSEDGIYCRRRLSLMEKEQREERLHNIVLRLHFPKITDPAHRSGVLSGLFFAKRFISYEYATRLRDGDKQGTAHVFRHLWNIVSTPFDTLGFLWHWLTKRTLAARKFPSVILKNKTNVFSLEVHGEQIPNPESRITLIEEKDNNGVPKVNIDWRYLPEDVLAVKRTMQILDEELRSSGVGTLTFNEETFEHELMRFGAYGGHHIGTTRMGTDPENSVVNPDCKVHGVNNLFIASSSVFPTSGQANPTLTITALALRLAEHLHVSMRCASEKPGQGAAV